ncbi:hypothetical protein FB2170_01975 [Maribacter sp. HTCC2170]|nr:hypothetical protein FB2170_01975 [Maribacter sp. HTCC2170]
MFFENMGPTGFDSETNGNVSMSSAGE